MQGEARCINVYDMRLTDSAPACGMNWPTELVDLYAYLRDPDVTRALHLDKHHKPGAWVECDQQVGRAIHEHAADSNASVALLPSLLNRGVPVLLFAGDQDVLCPVEGLQHLVERLKWLGRQGPGDEKPQAWTINGSPVGTWLHARNLTLAALTNASHMAAYDAPLAAHDMMVRFLDVPLAWAPGAVASVRSRIGTDERVLVAANTTAPGSLADGGASASAAPGTSTAAARPSAIVPTKAPPTPHGLTDGSGNLLVLFFVALAVGLCIHVRRRARRRAVGQYHAIGEHIVLEPPMHRHDDDEPFALGDADDDLP